MVMAAARTEAWDERSSATKYVWMEGYCLLMVDITDVILGSVRPVRMTWLERPAARESAVRLLCLLGRGH